MKTLLLPVTRLTLTHLGLTGQQWIERLQAKAFRISDYAKEILLSSDFMSAPAGTTTEIVILNGKLFEDRERDGGLQAFASDHGLVAPNPEVACLLRETVSDEDIKSMKTWELVVMSNKFPGSQRLNVNRNNDGGRYITSDTSELYDSWSDVHSFVFAAS